EPRDLALRWSIDEPDDAIGAILGVNRATSWEEFRRALADFGAPPLSFSWADRGGTIGWLMAGRVPIRQGERGVVPVDGSSGANEWLGYIPVEELPHKVNPAAGYLVHSNNRPVGEEYEHWLGVDFYPGFRAGRIAALIEGRATHSVETFRAIQADVYSYPEHRLAQAVATLPAMSGALRPVQQMLQGWDGRMTLESAAATIAHHLFHQLRHHLVADELASWTARWHGKVSQPELQNLLPHAFGSWAWVLERLEEPEHGWWTLEGAPRRLGRDEMLSLALEETLRQLRAQWGDDAKTWSWGRVHQRALEHPLGAIPLVGKWFNRGPYPMPGGPFSPNPDLGTIHYHQPLPAIGATARLIADLSDWDNFQLSLPGNSGHPASPHYADGLKGWREVGLAPLPWTRPAVEKVSRGTLVIEPA
ncbi:MAG: penicillin acylase family protein, partial [Ardenticatenales bacterium]|nr:penicillin acylase family protein [Ardenticatenales bacterium]